MCLKTPMGIDTDDKDLEVLMAFNGSVTQGHYVPICIYHIIYMLFYHKSCYVPFNSTMLHLTLKAILQFHMLFAPV